MPFWRLYYHLVWATKDRAQVIQPEIEGRLFTYLLRKAAEMEVLVYALNAWYDHVHVVLAVPPKHAIADVVKELKGASSHYLNHEVGLAEAFHWQRGYGAFSMGMQHLEKARLYVENQKAHHREGSANAWLERCDEADEGPEQPGLGNTETRAAPAVREEAASYIVQQDEAPF